MIVEVVCRGKMSADLIVSGLVVNSTLHTPHSAFEFSTRH